MRGFLISLLDIILTTAVFAQPAPDVVWTHTYGNGQSDFLGAFVASSDGGFVACGMITRIDGGQGDGWLLKVDGQGNQIWSRTFGGAQPDELRRMAATSDGGYILCGGTHSSGGGGGDAYLVKTDSEGQVQWTHAYGGTGFEYAHDVLQLPDGNFVFTGQTSSTGAGSDDVWLVKVGPDGTQLWARTFGGTGTELANNVTLTPDGGFYLAGYTSSSGNGSWDFYVIKTGADGNSIWTHTYGGSGRDFAECLAPTSDGGVIAGGVTNSMNAEYSDCYVVKLDPNGNAQWARNYGGPQSDATMDISQLPDGSYMFSGITGTPGDGSIYRLSATGEPIWTRSFHNGGATWLLDLHLVADHGYVAVGMAGAVSDGYIVRLAPDQFTPEHHFEPVAPTGLPYALIVDSAKVGNQTLAAGNEIGIFDGDLCVGVATVGTWPLTATVWQGDPDHGFPGFTIGHPMVFRYWLRSSDTEMPALPTMSLGDGNFGTGAYSRLSLRDGGGGRLVIHLRGHFANLISLNNRPEQPTAEHIFGALHHLTAAYQDNGNVFIPPHINTIGELIPPAGYRLFCSEPESLVVEGLPLNPNLEYQLPAGRWNWISYPRPAPGPTEALLAPIAERLVIIQDDEGHAWIPAQHLNTLPTLMPGKGYMLIVNQDVSFHYVQVAGATNLPHPGESVAVPVDGLQPTGLPYQVVVHLGAGLLSNRPASIDLFDGDLCVGRTTLAEHQSSALIAAWQSLPDYQVCGFVPGHSITWVVKNSNGVTIATENSSIGQCFGSGAFGELNLDAAANVVPSEFSVGEGYPNPFNPTVSIPFSMLQAGAVDVKVINTLGQTVLQERLDVAAGEHRYTFDTARLLTSPVTGLYFVELRHGGISQIRKVLLVR